MGRYVEKAMAFCGEAQRIWKPLLEEDGSHWQKVLQIEKALTKIRKINNLIEGKSHSALDQEVSERLTMLVEALDKFQSLIEMWERLNITIALIEELLMVHLPRPARQSEQRNQVKRYEKLVKACQNKDPLVNLIWMEMRALLDLEKAERALITADRRPQPDRRHPVPDLLPPDPRLCEEVRKAREQLAAARHDTEARRREIWALVPDRQEPGSG
jgi:hypothetical protein